LHFKVDLQPALSLLCKIFVYNLVCWHSNTTVEKGKVNTAHVLSYVRCYEEVPSV